VAEWLQKINEYGKQLSIPRLFDKWSDRMKTFLISLAAVVLAVGATFYFTSGGELELPFALPWEQQQTVQTVSLPTYQPGQQQASTANPQAASTSAGSEELQPVAQESGDGTESQAAETQAGEAEAQAETPAQASQPEAVALSSPAQPASPVGLIGTTYSGEIAADRQVSVMAEVAGQVREVLVDVGDRVTAGTVLARIDAATLEAQREQALAGLIAAQSQLDLLTAEPAAADLEAARASVNAAAAAYRRAANGPSPEDLELALTQVRQAEASVRSARAAYNQVRGNPNIGMLPQSMQLEQATIGLEAAQLQYERTASGATEDAVAGAYAQLISARSQLNRLERGAEAAQIRAVEAQVRQAETALYLTQLQLDKATVTAPMDGVVAQVQTSAGNMAAPGAPIFVLLSDQVRISIPVEETRLPSLRVGQRATIQVNAFPGQTFEGRVTNIAPSLNTATRTVPVTIRPVEGTTLLMPGMSATVTLED
jgi:multidrug resistance efflux pump